MGAEVIRRGARVLGVTAWCLAIWLLLLGTVSVETIVVGLVVALVISIGLSGLDVLVPWRLLTPARLFPLCLLCADSAARIVKANLTLARIVWRPRLQLATGMVVVPTRMRGDVELAGIAIITSLIVDNQIVDVDRARHELLYHCIEVPQGDRYAAINGPVERRLLALRRRHD